MQHVDFSPMARRAGRIRRGVPAWTNRSAVICAALFLLFGVWHVYYTLGGPMPGAGNRDGSMTTQQTLVLWTIDIGWGLAAGLPVLLVRRTAHGGSAGRRMLHWGSSIFAVGLVGYGVVTTFLSFFVVTGRVTANDPPDLHFNYLWGILLFGPWFIALGSTLAVTAAGVIIGSRHVRS